MVSKAEKSTLKMLADVKWADGYKCYMCGETAYYEREENLARICRNKECKYEETVLKNSAFEGLRFPVAKALQIIRYLIENSRLNYDKKVFPISEDGKTDRVVTLNELIVIFKKGDSKISQPKFDKLVKDFLADETPYVAGMAKKFEVTVKTMDKFLGKLNVRIGGGKYDEPIYNLIDYFSLGSSILERCLPKLMKRL